LAAVQAFDQKLTEEVPFAGTAAVKVSGILFDQSMGCQILIIDLMEHLNNKSRFDTKVFEFSKQQSSLLSFYTGPV
jgi:hypothetical protein